MVLSAKNAINRSRSKSSRSLNEIRQSASPFFSSLSESAGVLGIGKRPFKSELAKMLPNLHLQEMSKFAELAQHLGGNLLSERLLNQAMMIRTRTAPRDENCKSQSMQSIHREFDTPQRTNASMPHLIHGDENFAIQKKNGDNWRLPADMRSFGAGQSMNSIPKQKRMINSKAQNLKITPIHPNCIQCTKKGKRLIKRTMADISDYLLNQNIYILDEILIKELNLKIGEFETKIKLCDCNADYLKILEEIIASFSALIHLIPNSKLLEKYKTKLSQKISSIINIAETERKYEYIRLSPKDGLLYIIQNMVIGNIVNKSDLIKLILNISDHPAKSLTANPAFLSYLHNQISRPRTHFQLRNLCHRSSEGRNGFLPLTTNGCIILTVERSNDEELIFSKRYREVQKYVLIVNIFPRNMTNFTSYIIRMINNDKIKDVFISIKYSLIYNTQLEADAFKISLSNEHDLHRMIDLIVQYQSDHLDDFGPASVPMARCPEKGFGISYGEIPVDDFGHLTAEGRFLTARIVALWNAFSEYSRLKASKHIEAGKEAEIMLSIVSEVFISCGIDPSDPSKRCPKIQTPLHQVAPDIQIRNPSESEEREDIKARQKGDSPPVLSFDPVMLGSSKCLEKGKPDNKPPKIAKSQSLTPAFLESSAFNRLEQSTEMKYPIAVKSINMKFGTGTQEVAPRMDIDEIYADLPRISENDEEDKEVAQYPDFSLSSAMPPVPRRFDLIHSEDPGRGKQSAGISPLIAFGSPMRCAETQKKMPGLENEDSENDDMDEEIADIAVPDAVGVHQLDSIYRTNRSAHSLKGKMANPNALTAGNLPADEPSSEDPKGAVQKESAQFFLQTEAEEFKCVPKSSLQPFKENKGINKIIMSLPFQNKGSRMHLLSKHRLPIAERFGSPRPSSRIRSAMHNEQLKSADRSGEQRSEQRRRLKTPSPKRTADNSFAEELQNLKINYPINRTDFVIFLLRLRILLKKTNVNEEFLALSDILRRNTDFFTIDMEEYLQDPKLPNLSKILPHSLSPKFSNLNNPLNPSCIEAFAHISRSILACRSIYFDRMISLMYFYSRLMQTSESYGLMMILLNYSGKLLFEAFAEAISAKPDSPFKVRHDKLYFEEIHIESFPFREFYNVLFPVYKSPEGGKIPEESFDNAADLLEFFVIIGRAFQNDYIFLQEKLRMHGKKPKWIKWVEDMKQYVIDPNDYIRSHLEGRVIGE